MKERNIVKEEQDLNILSKLIETQRMITSE